MANFLFRAHRHIKEDTSSKTEFLRRVIRRFKQTEPLKLYCIFYVRKHKDRHGNERKESDKNEKLNELIQPPSKPLAVSRNMMSYDNRHCMTIKKFNYDFSRFVCIATSRAFWTGETICKKKSRFWSDENEAGYRIFQIWLTLQYMPKEASPQSMRFLDSSSFKACSSKAKHICFCYFKRLQRIITYNPENMIAVAWLSKSISMIFLQNLPAL